MIRTLLKWTLLAAVAYGGYKGVEIYALLQLGPHLQTCELKARVCPLVEQRAEATVLVAAMNDVMRCVSRQQSFLEALVLPWNKQLTTKAGQTFDHEQAVSLCRAGRG
jgi:hypothetical protein